MIGLKLIYIANIIVAGWISISSMFFTSYAAKTIFSGVYPLNDSLKLISCLWFAIAILSVLGLFYPLKLTPVLILQLIYKGTWLMIVALPAIIHKHSYPSGMAMFFLIWVIVLPLLIPWSKIF